MTDLDAAMPNDNTEHSAIPNSWYVIISGPLEGVRFGNYDRETRRDVERYANCRAYGPNAGVTDEATATNRLREAREQR
eukprot:2354307-Pleurochrysis_carterae.AAC.1